MLFSLPTITIATVGGAILLIILLLLGWGLNFRDGGE
jgi:hypothetical protein